MFSRKIAHALLALTLGIAGLAAVVIFGGCDRLNGGKAALSSNSPKQLWHCGMHQQVIQDHPGDCPICHMALTPLNGSSTSRIGSPIHANPDGPEVQIDPTMVQTMGVRTAIVTRGPLSKTMRTVGILRLPESGMHDVGLKVGGWIDKLYADQEGAHVVKGDPLFEIYSPELQVTEQELISAIKAEKTLRDDADPTIRHEAKSLVESARRKLLLWDIAKQDIDAIAGSDQPPRDVPIRSPATGHVEEKMIVQGSAVQMGMKVMRIADHTSMWLEAPVYQEQLSRVKVGHQVTATLDGIPGKTFKGTITFAYPHVDHMTRTLTVRATLDNPDFELKPGMYATAQIMTDPVQDAVAVPREAVIDTGTRQIVFVAESAGHFAPRAVRMGIDGDDDKVQIVEGLTPGETVVTSGQFLLDAESRTIEASQKFGAGPIESAMAMPGTMPAGTQPAMDVHQLTVAYCPMVKADWIQIGDTIVNPYMGGKMLDCGSVKTKVPMPGEGSDLTATVKAYLAVARDLEGDKLNASSIQSLHTAVNKLAGDQHAPLKSAAESLQKAKDIEAARIAFKAVSDRLIAALKPPEK